MVSIIIVHYKVKKELFACLKSIRSAKTNVSYEVIVVDNDENKVIESELERKFSWVFYVKSEKNIGYGAGNNLGAKYAKGEYLFFLNPDTIIYNSALDNLIEGFRYKKNVAVVGPQLLNNNGKTMPQGTRTLEIAQGIICLSFINKFFPKNKVSQNYFLYGIDKSKPYEVDTVAGTALLIRKNIFFQIKGFDENFFLYFEEFDICRRIRELGFKIIVIPQAKVMHIWEVSTAKRNDVKQIFQKSRFYYFKKHYGLLFAIIVDTFCRINKFNLFLCCILLISIFVNFYKLAQLMEFIGDQGWFYLAAKDMLVNGKIPLVGITSSHIWLHQGPLWTYILAVSLQIFNFNPVGGAYLTSFLGTLTVFFVHLVCWAMFSRKVGIIAAILYATSPLIIMSNRFAYHTSIIPLFTTIYILFLFKWIKGNKFYFPFIILTLAVLYNLELATVHFWFVLIGIFIYGLWKRKKWALNTLKKNTILLSIIFFVIPMFPILIYDFNHNFVQTGGFFVWIFYKFFNFITNFGGLPHIGGNSLLPFLYNNLQKLIFLQNGGFSLLLFFGSFIYFVYRIRVGQKYSLGHLLIGLITSTALLALFINKTPSDAYLPILFPLLIIIVAIFIAKLASKSLLYLGITILMAIVIINIYTIVSSDFSYKKNYGNIVFTERLNAARHIAKIANGNKYNLIGKGNGSGFASFTMNYEYLAWWLGNRPSNTQKKLKIYISETKTGVHIESAMDTRD